MSQRIGAFFDFDRTLLETDSAAQGIRFLWETGLAPLPYILKVWGSSLLYKRHWISEETMARILLGFYKGKPLDPFVDGICEFYEELIRPRLSKNILEKFFHHKKQGHVTVLISGSLRYTLEPVRADLGFDHLLCSDLETGPDGLLTGRTRGPLCIDEEKVIQARALAEAEGIDLSRSYAYGNHQADIPLLSMVGHAFAVEPTEPLRQMALEKGWPVLGFR
ncbi:MAG: HAD family hydrolase [Desulfatibacillum sp.]|nr:HAD family hydrolase [Desulfatibacillum sp.]